MSASLAAAQSKPLAKQQDSCWVRVCELHSKSSQGCIPSLTSAGLQARHITLYSTRLVNNEANTGAPGALTPVQQ
jgi:hypothetical protein